MDKKEKHEIITKKTRVTQSPNKDLHKQPIKESLAKQPEGEIGGPQGLEPTRYGDWESNGRCTDF